MPATPAAGLINGPPAICLVAASSSHCCPHNVGLFNPNPRVLPSVEQGYAAFDFASRPRLACATSCDRAYPGQASGQRIRASRHDEVMHHIVGRSHAAYGRRRPRAPRKCPLYAQEQTSCGTRLRTG